jgi:hypothetical protein
MADCNKLYNQIKEQEQNLEKINIEKFNRTEFEMTINHIIQLIKNMMGFLRSMDSFYNGDNVNLGNIDTTMLVAVLLLLEKKNILDNEKKLIFDQFKELLKNQMYSLHTILCCKGKENPILSLLLKKQLLLNKAIKNAKQQNLFSYFNPPKSQHNEQNINMNPAVIFANPNNLNFVSKHNKLINYFTNRNQHLTALGKNTPAPDQFERTPSMAPTAKDQVYGGSINNLKLLLSKLIYKAYKKLKIITEHNKK